MPQFWRGQGKHGFRVRYGVRADGAREQREADLVFINERPFAVLEWAQTGAAMVTVELDPAKLSAADPAGSVFEYSENLVDPR
jgi:hypothetical protein